jgi:outer membrane protein
MNLKSSSLLLVFLVFCGLSRGQAQEKITLEQAINLALTNNIQLKQAKLNVALTAEEYKQSKWALTPSLNANSNLNKSFGRSFDQLSGQAFDQSVTSGNGSLSSSVVLFQGFQRINQISQNKYLLAADKSNAEKAKNDLILSVVSTYLQVLNAQDLVETAKQQSTFARMQLDREQKLFDVGNKTLADLSQAKAQFATADLNLTNAQNQSDLAFLNLAQLLERDPASPFEVEKPQVDALKASENTYEANAVYQTALTTYPDIKIAEYRTLAAKNAVSVARGGFSPRISFGGNLSTGYSSGRIQLIPGSIPPAFEKIPLNDQLSGNYSRGVGVSVSIPLWNGNQARSVVNRAKISYQNATLSEQLAKNNLNKVINQALYDLKAAQKRFESTQSAYNSSKEAFNVVEQRYTVGLVNTLDYYQTQVNLNKAAFDVIQAKYDLLFKTKVIDFYLGKPINF